MCDRELKTAFSNGFNRICTRVRDEIHDSFQIVSRKVVFGYHEEYVDDFH